MLTALKLHFEAEENATLPPYMGRAVHAAVLELLEIDNPHLSALLHETDGHTPLTCSNFLDQRPQGRHGLTIRRGQQYSVRVTGLTSSVSQSLAKAIREDPPRIWNLHSCRFLFTRTVCDVDVDAWTGSADYESLATQHLLRQGKTKKSVSLRFISPITFKSKGVMMPVPLPRLLFGSLADRWNAFSSVPLSQDLRDQIEERVVLSRYRMESQSAPVKNGSIVGGVGTATYEVKGEDSYLHAAVQLLADFAMYSGAGAKTTIGLGQIQRVDLEKRNQ